MKILMTTDTIGGIWNYSIDLISALEKFGVEAALVSMGRKLNDHQRKQTAALKNLQLYETDYKLEWMDDPWPDIEAAGFYLLEIENEFKPEIIHLNSYSLAILNFSAPVLVVAHSCVFSWYMAVFNRQPPSKWNEYYQNVSLGLKSADFVTAPTCWMIDSLMKIYGKFNWIGPIYNGRNFQCESSIKEPIIFAAGRIWDESKNIAVLQNCAKLVNWPISVAGENIHPNGKLYNFNNINHLGLLSNHQISEYYSKASIFVLPSKYEPFGLSALEAALGRCALVLSDIPGLKEIWKDNALYAEPNKPDDFAHKINLLINDSSKLKTFGEKAKKRAMNFSINKTAVQYLNLYKRLCMKSKSTLI